MDRDYVHSQDLYWALKEYSHEELVNILLVLYVRATNIAILPARFVDPAATYFTRNLELLEYIENLVKREEAGEEHV